MIGEQEQNVSKTSRCCSGSMIMQIILFGIWTPINIAYIVVGARNQNNCVAEPHIPIYMIVAGAFGLALLVLLPLECCLPKVKKILGGLIGLFLFAWFIAGSVWVFRIYRNQNRDCNNGMYLFVFSILIIQYIFIGIGIISTLLSCFCCENLCCAKICRSFESCLSCCPCLGCLKCLQCTKCRESCQCLDCSKCLQCCSCMDSCRCLECNDCSSCCDCFQSLCCCCKSIQCSSCLNCSKCSQCMQCSQCCGIKV
ncbi:transmembrane protein 272-like [Ranitomeya variabilis]|uniref:transmembrane protein 272-like n=1 Tax=Ranitomeya variabilis TaxID=490064 RepID=UPI004055C7CF